MSDAYKATDPDKAFFITTTVVDWIDLFTRKRHKDIIVDSLRYCQEHKELHIYAWCLMPSHLHLIISSDSEKPLSDVMRDFKKHTSKALLQSIEEEAESRREWLLERFSLAAAHLKRDQNFKVWQNGYHAEELRSNAFIYQKLEYLHNNPVTDGVVKFPHEYIYSSAPLYAGEEGLLDVTCITPRLQTVK